MKKISVAIDGPAGAGKSSVAKLAAKRVGYLYIDTGAMYRAITWQMLRKKTDIQDEGAVRRLLDTTDVVLETGNADRVFVNAADVTDAIREPEVTGQVSAVAALAAVRQKLVQLQQQMAAAGGVILDGRDIGTVVLPQAELKVFLTASIASRARRRWLEIKERGRKTTTLADMERDIAVRDRMDSEREISPLREAEDAVHVDNSDMTLEETADVICRLIAEREV